MNQPLKTTLAVLALFLPWRLKHALYVHALGWEVDATSRVGFSILTAHSVTLGPGSRIGHLNIVTVAGSLRLDDNAEIRSLNLLNGCEEVHLARHALVGYLNWISGPPLSSGLFPNSPSRRPMLRLGRHSTIVRQHRIECADAVEIGQFCDISGIRSQLLTHGIDALSGTQRTEPIVIGDYVLVNTTVIVQLGATIPDRTVVAPGAVVSGKPGSPGQLIGGVPARPIRELHADIPYFVRERGKTD